MTPHPESQNRNSHSRWSPARPGRLTEKCRCLLIENSAATHYSEGMAKTPQPLSSLPGQSLSWLKFLFDLYRYFQQIIAHRQHAGPYENLDYEATLELQDPQGETAVFKRRQRVKFLQDSVIAFQDYAWGDGDIFAQYNCSPGTVVDRYQEGDRWNILISLRETKRAGDTENFYIERTARHAFTNNHEWWQVEIRRPTKRLRLSLIFPQARPCQRAVLLQRSNHQTTALGQEHRATLADGRQIVSWETKNIKRLEIYTLKWRW